MKPAHWSKVAKAIKNKYGLDWRKAKDAYKALKTIETLKPSLRMVSRLPKKLPTKLKGARVKSPAKRAKLQKLSEPPKQLKPKVLAKPIFTKSELAYYGQQLNKPAVPIVLAPPPIVLGPAIVPKRQSARNQFEQILKDAGLPVAAIARNETGKALAANWRDKPGQEKLAKLLKQTFSQIKRDGSMKPQTKERLAVQLEKMLGVKRSNIIWNNIMRQLYGRNPRK